MLKCYGGVFILYHFRVLDWRKDMRSTLTFFMVGSWGLVPSTYFIHLESILQGNCLHQQWSMCDSRKFKVVKAA